MQKIPTLFVRDPRDRHHVLPTVTKGCEWVTEGLGTPTVKWNGTGVMLDEEGNWWARREVKLGKTPPSNYRPLSTDETTGKTVGWEPAAQGSFAKYHAEALSNNPVTKPGTYELVGPKINNNPDGFPAHILMPHGWAPLSTRTAAEAAPRTYEGLRDWLAVWPYEGLVWHHPDGRRAKIKAKDFTR